MFKRKKKTGCETPEFRKSTPPPPPPTSRSNAAKPNPNYVPPASIKKPRPTVFHMALENLNDWVKTSAQIGDVACGYDRETEHRYMYCYLKPDDNPVWHQMTPEFFEKHFKKENKGDEEMLGTINCTYETPCGWCSKWDKKCDRKIDNVKKYTEERLNFDLHYECLKKTLERDIREIKVTSEFMKYLEKRYIFSSTHNKPTHRLYPTCNFFGIPVVVDDDIESSHVIVFKKEDV